MSTEILLTFIIFSFTASITPGPNNLMMMASGGVFGLKRTIPHIIGVVLGFGVLLGAMILGLGLLMERAPGLTLAVQIAGASWLAWLGLKLCWSALHYEKKNNENSRKSQARPLKFSEAALFQWANPKALVMTTSCAAAFTGLSDIVWVRLIVMTTIFSFIGLGTSLLWTIMGSSLSRWLETGRKAAISQFLMGLLFVMTAIGLMFV